MDPMACSGYVSYNQPVRQGNVQFKKTQALVGLPIPILLPFQNPLKYGNGMGWTITPHPVRAGVPDS